MIVHASNIFIPQTSCLPSLTPLIPFLGYQAPLSLELGLCMCCVLCPEFLLTPVFTWLPLPVTLLP